MNILVKSVLDRFQIAFVMVMYIYGTFTHKINAYYPIRSNSFDISVMYDFVNLSNPSTGSLVSKQLLSNLRYSKTPHF